MNAAGLAEPLEIRAWLLELDLDVIRHRGPPCALPHQKRSMKLQMNLSRCRFQYNRRQVEFPRRFRTSTYVPLHVQLPMKRYEETIEVTYRGSQP